MSSISSSLTDPNDPYSSLYQLLNNSNQSLNNTTSSVNAAPPSPLSELDGDDSTTQSTSHHGHHQHGIPSQIEDAVTNALQSAAPGTDPNQTIQNAIASVLQQANGQDPTTASTTTPTTTTSPDNSTQSSNAFNQLLQSFGVDPKQFQQDLQAALQKNQPQNSNSPDFATLFRSFPPGSAVNTVG